MEYTNEELQIRLIGILDRAKNAKVQALELMTYEELITHGVCKLAIEMRDSYKKELDGVYTERAQCVATLCAHWHNLGFTIGIDAHSGEWDEDWRNIVYAELPTGQVSWHMHISDLPLFSHIPHRDFTSDGHTNEEKYKRIREMQSYPIKIDGGSTDEPVSDEASKIEDMQESIDQMELAINALEAEIESSKGGPSRDDVEEVRLMALENAEKANGLDIEIDELKAEVNPAIDQLEMGVSQHDTEIASLWEQIKQMEGNDG